MARNFKNNKYKDIVMMTPIKTSVSADKVYKRPEFSDLLKSNNFYTVSAIALVLGIASAFGFIQNPRKLKTVVDTISYKVSIAHPDNQRMSYQVFKQERYGLSASLKQKQAEKGYFNVSRHFDDSRKYLYGNHPFSHSEKNNTKRVAFSYDITSDKFWNDLNASSIGQVKDEMHKGNYNSLSLDIVDEGDVFLDKGDSKYSIASELRVK